MLYCTVLFSPYTQDKTGTITSPEAAFQHLVPVSDGMVGTALTNPAEAPLEFKV